MTAQPPTPVDSKSKTRDKSSLSDAKSKPKVKRRKIAKGLQTKEAARGCVLLYLSMLVLTLGNPTHCERYQFYQD